MITESDRTIINSWLNGKSKNTAKSYMRTMENMFAHIGKTLVTITLADLQDWQASLTGADNTLKAQVNTVKSLFTFLYDMELTQRNVGVRLIAPEGRGRNDSHILTEADIEKIIGATTKPRDKALIRILYATGGRIGEVCSMKWCDVEQTTTGGQVQLFGKGSKDRIVRFSPTIWNEFKSLRHGAGDNAPVFLSQKGGHLDPSQAWRIVRAAAVRAGISGNVSPHWFRHCHASHALAQGATLAAVRDTLGHSHVGITDMYVHAKTGDSSAYYL